MVVTVYVFPLVCIYPYVRVLIPSCLPFRHAREKMPTVLISYTTYFIYVATLESTPHVAVRSG